MSDLTYAPDLIYRQELEAEYLEAKADSDGSVLREWIEGLEHATHAEIVEAYCDSFELFCEACLMVVDKQTGDMRPLVLKPAQRLVARRILKRWYARKPVRLIILKARREGVSTVVQAFIFWVCWSNSYRTAVTVAHDDETTSKIFEMSETFYKELDADVRPQRDRAKTGAHMRFANPSKNPDDHRHSPGLNSSMRTVSLRNAGTGSGAMLLHLSEVAKWKGVMGDNAMRAVLQIVPAAPFTLVVWESTADGMDDHFEPAWTRAEEGEGDYEPIFIPWNWEPTYRMAAPDFHRTDEEERLAERYGLDDEQLAWRRWCIENQCGGSIDTFHQEYPLEPREAFLSSGRPYFDRVKVDDHMKRAMLVTPWQQGDLTALATPAGRRKVILVPKKRGRVKVWEAPIKGVQYIIAADPSEGSGSDPQAAYVLPRQSPIRFAAAWHGRLDRFDFGDELYLLGCLYNVATIVVETSGGWGGIPIARLREKNYPRIYREIIEDKVNHKRTERLGFVTNNYNRDALLQNLAEAVHRDIMEPLDADLYKEMMKFIYVDRPNAEDAKAQAEGGAHDDRIMAAGIALHTHLTLPMPRVYEEIIDDRQPDPVTGY